MKYIDSKKIQMPSAKNALPGRTTTQFPGADHLIFKHPLLGPYPVGTEILMLGMGCFWGVERLFWSQSGIYITAVGYSAGITPNPTYEEVCSGMTGHNEVVLIVYWPKIISNHELLRLFWQNHNPTTGMQQANDIGSQYRSGIYTTSPEQFALAESSKIEYQQKLPIGKNITTEILPATEFYFAENYHQQYLAKNPDGWCNMQSIAKTGLPCL